MSRVSGSIDDAARRFVIQAQGLATGRDLVRLACQMFTDHPILTTYDAVWDLTGFSGDATNEDLAAIRACYMAALQRGGDVRHTCFATLDPCFPFWARAMDELFPDRRHRVFVTVRAAHDFIDKLRGPEQGRRFLPDASPLRG